MYSHHGLGACACVRAPCDACHDTPVVGTGPGTETQLEAPLPAGTVTVAEPVLDRSATLGDLATLGSALSMIFFLFKGR